MKKHWLAVLVFLLWTFVMLLFHQFFPQNLFGEHNDNSDQEQPNHLEKQTETLEIAPYFYIANDDGSVHYQFDETIKINPNNGDLEIPKNLMSFADSIYHYLNSYQDKEVLIGVKHLASEVDSAKQNHFGKDRVKSLETILVAAGINPDRLFFELIPTNYTYDENDQYDQAISIRFKTISEEHGQQIDAGIRNKTLYADFAQAEFKPDKTLTAYTLELKNYLAKYSGRSIVVTGHTDSVGVNNNQWGLDRANNVKNYLISQGIPASIIEVVSKGESDPIASNLTEEGRAKNRRIVITVK